MTIRPGMPRWMVRRVTPEWAGTSARAGARPGVSPAAGGCWAPAARYRTRVATSPCPRAEWVRGAVLPQAESRALAPAGRRAEARLGVAGGAEPVGSLWAA